MEINKGDKIQIKKVYGKLILTVTEIQADGCLRCEDERNNVYFIPQAAIDYYLQKNFLKVISRAERLSESQTFHLALLDGEKAFAKVYKEMFADLDKKMFAGSDRELRAKTKAEVELKHNPTIRFENGVLRFTSRQSGRHYIVTKDGCSTNCPASSSLHYHTELYKLMAATNVVEGNFNRQTVRKMAA